MLMYRNVNVYDRNVNVYDKSYVIAHQTKRKKMYATLCPLVWYGMLR